MRFSAIYIPTALFSLKDSNATNSGAKTLFLPSPYAIKMAILNQAITTGGVDFDGKKNEKFSWVSRTKIDYRVQGGFCVSNSFVKILKPERSDGKKDEDENEEETKAAGFSRTVAFREYLHQTDEIEIIFEYSSKDLFSENQWKEFIQSYLYKINYFGKRGCFFQFKEFRDSPGSPNVTVFDSKTIKPGILQPYDDFPEKATFDMVNTFSSKGVKRKEDILVLPLQRLGSSKGYSSFKAISP